MKSMAWKMMVAGGVLAMAACGGSEGGGEPGGAPIAEVQGEVRGSTGNAALTNASVALVWASFEDEHAEPVFATEVAPLPGGNPGSFTLPVFGNPPANLLLDYDFDFDGTNDARIAFGFVFGFEDVNGDGAVAINENGIDAPDRIFGLAAGDMLVYVDQLSNPAAFEGVFTNPEALVTGQILLAKLDWCSFGYELQPVSTPVVLYTFEPVSQLPEDGIVIEGDLECPGWPEDPNQPGRGGICGNDPSGEACQACIDDAFAICQEQTCAAESTTFIACAETNGCIDDADGTCIEEHCLAEADALYFCIGGCSGWEACFVDAPADE